MKNKLKEIWRGITYWPRRKFRQIKNVIDWIPVVWNQFDFDYSYSLQVFKHQLLKQAKHFEKPDSWGERDYIKAQKIRMICRLMDKVYAEDYACEYQDRLKEKYGDDVIDWVFSEIPEEPGMNRMNWKYEVDAKFESQRDQIKEDSDKWFHESHDKQKRAHKLLWKLVEHNIQRWWN